MSKGSKQRPIEDKKKFDENWDRIFKKHLANINMNLYMMEILEVVGFVNFADLS